MKGSRVAVRYARALLELADKGNEEVWGAELERLAAMVEEPEVLERLASPELSEESRQAAMTKSAERLGLSFPLRLFAAGGARDCRIPGLGATGGADRDRRDGPRG